LTIQILGQFQKTQMSFNQQTSAGSLFICSFQGSGENFMIWIRSDSMQSRFDFQAVANRIKAHPPADVSVGYTPTWFILTFPASCDRAQEASDLIVNEIASQLAQAE